MAAMTQDPTSRGQVTIPANVRPLLCDPCPEEFPVGVARSSIIKCTNVAFGSRFQINGADSAATTWVSPSTILLNWTPTIAGFYEGTVISPEGLVSNKIRLTAQPVDNDSRGVPSVQAISPTSGTTAGGTGVTISGQAFAGATGVTIGGVACTSVIVTAQGTITCLTGAHAAGACDVVVQTPRGNPVLVGAFTYV